MRPDVPAEPHARTSRPRLRSPRCPSRQVRTDSLQVRRRKHRTRALLPGAPRARLPSQARRCHGRGMPKPSPREKRVMQISKRLSTCAGSARPVVSQRQISASGRIGIRRSRSAIVLASGTRPSKGQSKAVAMFNRMNRPVGMAASRRAYSSADSSGYRVRGGRTNDNRDEV